MGKRGPKAKPKDEQGVTETFHKPKDCGDILTELKALGIYGRSNGKVICFALKHLKNNPPAPDTPPSP